MQARTRARLRHRIITARLAKPYRPGAELAALRRLRLFEGRLAARVAAIPGLEAVL